MHLVCTHLLSTQCLQDRLPEICRNRLERTMHAGTDYADLQDALLTQCIKSATFLSQRDLTALTAGQIDTVSDPPSVQTAVMVPSDYGAFPNFSIAVLKRKCEQITLLLPFRDDVAISINIWQPFWDIDRESFL